MGHIIPSGNSLRYLTTNPRGTQAHRSKNSGKFPILIPCHGLNYAASPQLNSWKTGAPISNHWIWIAHLFDYADTNPNAVVKFRASDMVFHLYSDSSYLSEPQAHSHNGGNYYLISKPSNHTKAPHLPPLANEPTKRECIMMRKVVASTSKSEVGGIFHNGKIYILLRITLNELGFTQPPTSTKTDNSAAEVIVAAIFRPKSSKAMDMIFVE